MTEDRQSLGIQEATVWQALREGEKGSTRLEQRQRETNPREALHPLLPRAGTPRS